MLDHKQAARETGRVSRALAPVGGSPGAPAASPRTKLLRRLDLGYRAALHLLVGVLLINPGAVPRAQRLLAHDPSVTEEYQGMVTAQVAVCDAMPDHAVVFLGDSRLRRLLIHETVLPDVPMINLSIGGDTTKGLLGRVGRYRNLERASRLVLGTGINDLSHFPDDQVLDYYTKALSLLSRIGPRVTAVAMYPINEKIYDQANVTYVTGLRVTNARIQAVNARLRKACEQFSNIAYVDVSSALIGEDGNLLPSFSSDGLHLNDEGNRAWGDVLRSRISGV